MNYSYLADGSKLSATDGEGDGLLYRGSLIYRKTGDDIELESAAFSEGRFVRSAGGSIRPMIHITDHLGSVRAVVDGLTGQTVETNDYYPFGSRWEDEDGISDPTNRYRFNGKEDQEGEFGVPTLDYGARHYTPSTARWLSMDPLSEKYYGVSPYAFCNNDPVNFVDPDGRGIYSIDPNGRISKINDDENVHELHLVDKDGNTTGKMIELSNSEAMEFLKYEKGKEIYSYTASEGNIDNVFKIFKFAADNTSKEWTIHRGYENNYTIGMIGESAGTGGWSPYGIEKPIASIHSHPMESGNITQEIESMGYNIDDDYAFGDWGNVVNDVRVNGRQTRYNYVYFPKTGHLFHVEYYSPRYIKKINSYKNFYFGTLNHK